MQFDPYANKVQFEAFTLDSAPCAKCICTKALIAPTNNTHAASARCSKCGKFYRWLGKRELESLAIQYRNSKMSGPATANTETAPLGPTICQSQGPTSTTIAGSSSASR